MSRLDSFIRRLTAQRDCLAYVVSKMGTVPGPVLELGLGNGRTYDHLRHLFPEREIFVFDRKIAAHPDSIPDDAYMIVGEFAETLPGAKHLIKAPAALVHADFGSGVDALNTRTADILIRELPGLVATGAMIVADQPLDVADWDALPLPEGVPENRYFIYRAR